MVCSNWSHGVEDDLIHPSTTSISHGEEDDDFKHRDDKTSKKPLVMLQKHKAVREKADLAYRKNAERLQHKYSKQRKVHEFSVGESASLRILRIDRAATVLQRLPCVVVMVTGKAQMMYRLRCSYGVLNRCYRAGDLEPFSAGYSIPVDGWEEEPHISLREAARNQAPWNAFAGNKCNCCPGACDSRRCPCKKKGIDCSSHCHRGEDCKNKVYDGYTAGEQPGLADTKQKGTFCM